MRYCAKKKIIIIFTRKKGLKIYSKYCYAFIRVILIVVEFFPNNFLFQTDDTLYITLNISRPHIIY